MISDHSPTLRVPHPDHPAHPSRAHPFLAESYCKTPNSSPEESLFSRRAREGQPLEQPAGRPGWELMNKRPSSSLHRKPRGPGRTCPCGSQVNRIAFIGLLPSPYHFPTPLPKPSGIVFQLAVCAQTLLSGFSSGEIQPKRRLSVRWPPPISPTQLLPLASYPAPLESHRTSPSQYTKLF